ncbi:MAG: recR [Rhodospirillales bacterium]|nr:recR [Rhodospirillales bacterium]
MAGVEIEKLVQLLAKLPGLGPRSARRAALTMLKRRDTIMIPLAEAIETAAQAVRNCTICGNLDTEEPCNICREPHRDSQIICVVEEVADLWALERSGAFRGRYHVLGGTLSPFQGVGPQDLSIDALVSRAREAQVTEVILALNATVEGQTTGHFIAEQLIDAEVKVTYLAHGVPMGGELDYLDDGTLTAALKARR